jgi:hypothetical protein
MADAEADPAVVVAAMGGDRPQAVMARIAAADLHPELGRGKVELVVEHGDVPQRDLEEVLGFPDRPPGLVHVGLRLQQQHLLAADHRIRRLGLEAPAPGARAMGARNLVHGHEADVVAVPGVAGSGIAEADEEAHRLAFS